MSFIFEIRRKPTFYRTHFDEDISLQYYDLAADLLAENTDMTFKYMEPYIYEFIEAKIVQQTATDAAFKKFDDLAGTLIEQLRRVVKEVQENRRSQKDEQVKKKVQEYDATLEKYLFHFNHLVI